MLHPKFAVMIAFVVPAIVAVIAREPIAPVIALLISVGAAIWYGKYYNQNKPTE